jgi:phosphatidylserine decarboxylase
MALLETLRLVLAPPHRAGRPFIAGGCALAVFGLFVHPAWLAAGLLFALFSCYFFRDPERASPLDPHAIVSGADGIVVSVAEAPPPAELGLGTQPRWRVATFLSILNVHVNRVPAAGTVTAVAYRAGSFLNASLDKASDDNERNAIAIRLPSGETLAVVQIAGLVARRILCELRVGDPVTTGQRLGIIRFGSRTDIYLPAGVAPLVRVGQTMIGGETVLARTAAAAPAPPVLAA